MKFEITLDIVGKRKIFLIGSGVLNGIAILAIIIFGFKLSIEFTGGSKLEVVSANGQRIDVKKLESVIEAQKINVVTIQQSRPAEAIIRTDTISDGQKNQILAKTSQSGIDLKEVSFDTLGPVIGTEAKVNALKAAGLAIIAITLYIAFAFRKVSKPVSSWKFGISAIVALAHDVLMVLGAFSLFGLFFGVEIDSLFITAILTIMGFSVHDTIVVFDRIRENIIKNVHNKSFEEVVNNSFNETLARSLNTSLTVILVLFALLLFGGESVRWFIVAFLIGLITGTYSSIFIASAVLVEWYQAEKRGFSVKKLIGSIKPQGFRKK